MFPPETATPVRDYNLSDPVNIEQLYGRPRQQAPYRWGLAPAFGGLKKSTIGPEEMGSAADFYTQTKTIYLYHS